VGYPNRKDAAYILPGHEYQHGIVHRVYKDLMTLVRVADDTGWDGVFFPEHHSRAANGLSPAPTVLASAAAVTTSRVRIGTMGICLALQTQPLRVAEELALVDNLSDGRVVAGFVRGGDFWAFKLDIAESRERFEQALGLVRRAWTAAEPFAYHTTYFDYDLVSALPRPVQRPHPPLWMACNSAESLEFAARERLAVVTSWSPTSQVAETFEYYRRYAREQCGWEPTDDYLGVSRDVYVAPTMAQAVAEAAEEVVAGQDDDFGGGPNPAYKKKMEHDQYSARSFAYKSGEHIGVFQVRGWSFEQLQREGLAVVGDPDYVTREILSQREALGIGHFFVRPMFGRLGPAAARASVELYAREVIPHLRQTVAV
jgi:alkanesulfonate monooxygenase SsuD/methylene tetrahydromethanopterin reductase-like flavin-dependent oxidoreductase (luciferase family)